MYMVPELTELKEILDNAIELAQEYEKVEQPDQIILSKIGVKQLLSVLNSKEKIALKSFLECLPENILIGILTVMYIGDEGKIVGNKELAYRNYFQSYVHWEKNDIISLLIGKAELSKYLQSGKHLLF